VDQKTFGKCCFCLQDLDVSRLRHSCDWCDGYHCTECECPPLATWRKERREEDEKPCRECGKQAMCQLQWDWCVRCFGHHCPGQGCTRCIVCMGIAVLKEAGALCARCGYSHCARCGCPPPDLIESRHDWLDYITAVY
jgi:hypothetical protein